MDSVADLNNNELLTYLSSFITKKRMARMEEVVIHRTRHMTVVLENVFQSHNTSAVLRSCDCFGIQDVHIIENANAFKSNPDIALGADKWLSLHHYRSGNATIDCLSSLKGKGYKIVATTPHRNSYDLDTLPVDSKIALVFGTEMEGISPVVDQLADCYVKIPMTGFTESLNISVSAAVCLYTLTQRIKNTNAAWQLPENEKTDILIRWVKNTLKQPEILVRQFFKMKNHGTHD